MQKMRLNHVLAQRLSPQQIQTIKLLQVPSAAMEARIKEELASNPALDEENSLDEQTPQEETSQEDSGDVADYYDVHGDDYRGPHVRSNASLRDLQEISQARLSTERSLEEYLLEQLSFLQLDEQRHKIGVYLIGSIEGDGYIRRDLSAIVNDLATTQYLETSVREVVEILGMIQHFDPPGIGARNLQECLLIQLAKQNTASAVHTLAIQIIQHCFEAFTKRQYSKIVNKLGLEDTALLKEALALITKLAPRPGDNSNGTASHKTLYPDFTVTKQNNQLHVTLNNYHLPTLRVSKNYVAMLEGYHRHKKKSKQLREAAIFVRKKLEAAQWFIDAVRQRQQTLMHTMKAIVQLQHDFFMEEEESKLKPMGLKYVAEQIGMDVSTISRVVSNKSVQTDLNVYPLKFFFTEAISTTSGEEVSN
ncbi:MAG: RNA polymerase factor sigma-54, partial [Bacteroidota bacterium]